MADSLPCVRCGQPRGPQAKAYCSYVCWNAAELERGVERFWAKVNKNGPVMPGMTTPCWVWVGSRDKKGYGRLGRIIDGKLKPLRATRYSLELHLGRSLSSCMLACHKCDNPPCVRPDHLFEGTNKDNYRDSATKGRTAMQRCPERCRVAGERHGQSKLNDEKVLAIRCRYGGGGITMRALATEYGVGIARISEIVNGKAWATTQQAVAHA